MSAMPARTAAPPTAASGAAAPGAVAAERAAEGRVWPVAASTHYLKFGRPDDRYLALLMLAISGAGSLGGLGFWIAGHGYLGLRALCGSILLILVLLLA